MNTPALMPQQQTPRAALVPIVENEVAEVSDFIATQSGRTKETVEAHLRWFMLENPAREPAGPLGFGLRTDDRLVGCILCSPQAFRFGGDRIVLMGSSSFYVDAQYRGHGGRIFLQYCRLAKQWPLFGTSANAEAAALWQAAGASPLPGFASEMFGVIRWPAVAEEFAHRRNPSPFITRLAGSALSRVAGLFRPLKLKFDSAHSLQQLTQAEQANDLPIHGPSMKLTAMRDLAYLRWRYFSGNDATTAAFAFRTRQPEREILVTVNQRRRGYRGQINTLNVLDVYPEVPVEEWLRIVAALIARYEKSIDAVVLRGQDAECRKLFGEKGFQARAFDAPIGWCLDKAKLLPTHDWHVVPADGDGLI